MRKNPIFFNSGMVKRKTLGFRRATSNQRSVYGNKNLIIVKQNLLTLFKFKPDKASSPVRWAFTIYKGTNVVELKTKPDLNGCYRHLGNNLKYHILLTIFNNKGEILWKLKI